jgi:hypothetical protein
MEFQSLDHGGATEIGNGVTSAATEKSLATRILNQVWRPISIVIIGGQNQQFSDAAPVNSFLLYPIWLVEWAGALHACKCLAGCRVNSEAPACQTGASWGIGRLASLAPKSVLRSAVSKLGYLFYR